VILAPVQDDAFKALRAYLLSFLPSGVEVIQAQVNRVPEPKGPDFVTMNAIRRERLETNVDDYDDASFTAVIAGTAMTVSAVVLGKLVAGAALFGANLAAGSAIVSQTSGTPGGVGVYVVAPSQAVASQAMAAGLALLSQPTKVVVQLDVHGPNSGDNAQAISTALRDDYAVFFFERNGYSAAPLYSEDPRQIPFINAEKQYEDRWVIEASLQVNPTLSLPQQFADQAVITTINVEETYPQE